MNVLPCPGVLSSRISPPSSVASSRLMARPRPVPPYLRLVPASACWNASKMSRCFSGAMPMPVSVTSNATTVLRLAAAPGDRRSSPPSTGRHVSRTPPCAVNLKALDSRFLRICCRRFGSRERCAAELRSMLDVERQVLRLSATWWNVRSTLSRRAAKVISSASTVTVPDSIFDRSRMSLIRVSRSVPAEWMVRANSTCFGDEVAVGVFGELLAEDQDAS